MIKQLSLIIAAGRGCFTCCKGCYQYFGKTEINTKDIIEFIKKYKHKFLINKVTLAGGDPLTRLDIVDLITEISKLGLKINLDTVGKPFIGDSEMVFHGNETIPYISIKNIKEYVDVIGIPLDGCTTEQINTFRTNITINEISKILEILNNNGVNICINTVVNKNNFQDLYKIYSKIKDYPYISKWQLFQYSPTGQLGYNNRNLFKISKKEFNKAAADLLNEIGNYNNIEIQIKSNDMRKFSYLLINSDGEVWYPRSDFENRNFSKSDESPYNNVIGTIFDSDILEKIEKEFNKIDKREFLKQ